MNKVPSAKFICAILFAIALAGFSLMYFSWPLFDKDFWYPFWLAYPALIGAFLLSAYLLIRSSNWLLKILSLPVFSVALLLLSVVSFVVYELSRAGASIKLLETAETNINPDARKNHLVYLQLQSTNPNPGSPIVYLSGGPGGSAILSLYSARFPMFMAMRSYADVIAWEQRGNMPWNDPWLTCPNTWDYPLDEVLSRLRLLEIRSASIEQCQDYYSRFNYNLQAYNTAESVEDLDDLRQQLGFEKITLWGTSFGTHLALAYAKKYPANVESMILHGTEGLNHTLKLPGQIQQALEKTDQIVSITKFQNLDLINDLETTIFQLQQQPVAVKLNDTDKEIRLGTYDIQFVVANLLSSAASRAQLPALVEEMKLGDFQNMATRALRFRQGRRENLMALTTDCSSGASPERLQQIEQESVASLLGNAINDGFPEICATIDHIDLGTEFRQGFDSAIPTLFISGTLDGRTPPSNAEEILSRFSQGIHLVVENAGHGDELFLASPDILEVMQQFMAGEDLASRNNAVPF